MIILILLKTYLDEENSPIVFLYCLHNKLYKKYG